MAEQVSCGMEKANRSKRFVQHEHKQKNAYVPTWTHSSRILDHTSPGDVFLALPCRGVFSTISFGIQKNSGPPAQCNDFYNFKIVGDNKTFSNLAFTWGKPSKG